MVDQIIEKCCSNKLRKRLLRENDLKLAKLLELAQIIEATDKQAQQYSSMHHSKADSDSNDVCEENVRKVYH